MKYYKILNGYRKSLVPINNGTEITEEEYNAAMTALQERLDPGGVSRYSQPPLSVEEILRIDMRQRVNSLVIDNQTAGRMIDYFPTMSEFCAAGALIPAKTRIRDDKNDSVIWRSNVDVWNTESNSPTNAPTLWDRIAYHNGIRIIPDVIPATLAWMKDELGWRDGHVYKSGMDGNVYLPGTVGALWEQLT